MTSTLLHSVRPALAACLATTACAAAVAASWPQPAFDAGQTFYNPGEKILTTASVANLVALNSLQPGYNAATAPTLAGSSMFLCSDKYELGSFDAASGALLWSSTAPSGTCGGAVLGGGSLYTTAWRLDGSKFVNTLASVDPSSGKAQWQVPGPADPKNGKPSWLTFNLPTLSQGTLYVSHGRSLVSAYKAGNGHLRWRVKTGSLNNQVAVADGLVFTTTWAEGKQPNRLYAYDAATGARAWSQPVNGSQYPAAAGNGRVFVASNYAAYAFDAASGTALWEIDYATFLASPPVLTPQSLIVNPGHSTLQALDPATGAVQWTTTLPGSDGVESNLVVAGDVLYAGAMDFSGNMRLAAFDVHTGQQLLRSTTTFGASYAQLHVAGGKVYMAFNGQLEVFGLPD